MIPLSGHRDGVNLHATCLVLDEGGILIRGPSGSGKSTLARDLLDRAEATGRFARLVCDDRVLVFRTHGRIVARGVPAIAGRLEIRGVGLVSVAWEPAAVVRLVVDCGAPVERMPDPLATVTSLLGLDLPRLALDAGDMPGACDRSLWRWRCVCDTILTVP